MKISVILPCYNVEPYIRNGLDSIFSQTYQEWEAILVDDGSTDKTGQIIDSYEAKDFRFKAVHTENQGVSAARNVGLSHAKGDIVYFMDPDDEISPECFFKCIDAFEKNNPDIVHFNRRRIKNGVEKKDSFFDFEIIENESILKEYSAGLIGLGQEALYHYYKGEKIFNFKQNWQVWSFMIKRSLIIGNSIRFHEELKMFEDSIFLVEATMVAKKIVRIPNILYTYYIRDSGALNSRKNDPDKIFYDKYQLIKYRSALRKKIDKFDLHNYYIGSQVFSCLQLIVKLSCSKQNFHFCQTYINAPEIQESIQSVDIKKSPLKFRLPVMLLKHNQTHFLFYLCCFFHKIGLTGKMNF